MLETGGRHRQRVMPRLLSFRAMGAPGAPHDGRPRLKPFLAAACAIIALLFVDAATGRVLSQTDILEGYSPWYERAQRGPATTDGGRRPGNVLLGDVPTFVYPSLALTRSSLLAGRFPLWNPDMYAGQPFLASYQTGLLSPAMLLSVLFEPPDALLAHAVLRLLLGGVGMFLFLRRLGLAPPAVWFGALAFLLNPFSMVWLEHPPSAVSGWLPWLLWSVERNRQVGGPGNVALLAVVSALTLLAGHPETAFKIFLLAGAYSMALSVVRTTRSRWRLDGGLLFGRLLPAVLLGACLAAAQIVPFVEYMHESGIAAHRRVFRVSPFTIPVQASLVAVVPEAFGNPARGDTLAVRNAAGAQANFLEQQISAGNVVWILVGVALATRVRQQWRVAFLVAMAITAAGLVYGAPGLSRAFALIPMAGLSAPARFGLITIACAVVLGAIGLSALCEAEGDGRGLRLAQRGALHALLVMAIFAAAMVWWQWPLFRYGAFVRELGLATLWSGGVALAGVLLIVGWTRGLVGQRTAVVLLMIVSTADLFALGFRFHPMLPRAGVFPSVPPIDRIKEDKGLYRIAGFGKSLPPNTAMAYGLADPRGYDGVAPRHFTDLLGRAFGSAMLHRIDRHGALPILDLLNVKYLIANDAIDPPVPAWRRMEAGPSTLYRNDGVFPRAWLVDRAVRRDDPSTLDWMVAPASDLRHEAPLAELLDAAASPEPADRSGVGDVSIVRYEPAQVVLTSNASGRRVLILADAWYPGWNAYVDGRRVPIVRAYYALRALPVPAGRHTVRFSYEPQSVRVGVLLSAVGLAVLGALIAASRRRTRSSDT